MIETAVGVGISLISGEHLFSTLLSSPWTVSQFVKTEEDKQKIRNYYTLAVILTLATASLITYLTNQIYPLTAALILCILYITIYEKALG